MLNFKKNRRYFLKPLLFIGIVFLLQWLTATYVRIPGGLLAKKFKKLELLKKHMRSPMDVLYFGDSTIWCQAKEQDKDKRSIIRMLQTMTPGLVVKGIVFPAYQADIYAAYCQYIVSQKKKHKPRFIVIPINMRSFSPHWDMRPGYQFDREKIILTKGLRYIFYSPLRIFKYNFNTVTRKEYDETPVFKGRQRIGTVKRMKGLKDNLVLCYMYPLTREHRKVQALIKIAQILPAHGINVIFYATPLDVESGEKYFPGEFTQQVRQNIRLIGKVLEENGHQLLDLSMDLPEGCFVWKPRDVPNEHMYQKGRMYVARELAREIKRRISRN